jgi:hypothetical protein
MAVKKKTATKAAKKPPNWKYVGVSYDGVVYFSEGPMQIIDSDLIMFPSKMVNEWTSDPGAKYTKYKSIYVTDEFTSGEAFVCPYADFIAEYSDFGKPPKRAKKLNKKIDFSI